MSEFEMRLRGRRLCTGTQAKEILERELRPALKKAGFILQGLLMRYSPVRTGTLRRSWNVGEPQWRGDAFLVKVGSLLVYARMVAKRGRSAGYDKKAVDDARAQVKAAIQEALRKAIPQMYVTV